MLVNLKKLVFSRVLSHRQHLEKRPRGNMGTVCEPESSGSNSGESGASNRNRGSGRHKAAKQLKQYVKDANLEDLCSRITRGMGTDDLSALLMPKDDLEKTIVDLDDGPEGWNQTAQHREQSTTDRVAKCPKDHLSDDKDANSTIDAQPMYPIMSSNMQHSDYKPMLKAQVPMTGSQHVTTQPPNTAMYMNPGSKANLTVCTEHISEFISLLNIVRRNESVN